MNKKITIGVFLVIIIIAVATGAIFITNSNNSNDNNIIEENTENTAKNNEENLIENTDHIANEQEVANTSKTLVVYYSAQSHTKAVSEKIAEELNADIFEIVPEDVYTSDDLDWTDTNSRVTKEHDDESLRDIKLEKDTVDNWNEYDTVLIGYPIWWGIAAWPVDTFIKANDFSDKIVIPFCTSMSSGLGESGKLLKEEANGGNWLEGHRFNSNPTDSDIKNWIDSLK